MESEQRRRQMCQVYNSYRAAKSQFAVEDIPMPDTGEGMHTHVLSCLPTWSRGPPCGGSKLCCSVVFFVGAQSPCAPKPSHM